MMIMMMIIIIMVKELCDLLFIVFVETCGKKGEM